MYLFHYTNKGAYEAMTAESPWTCEARQPQQGVWYSDQHEFGFYVTALSPFQMMENNKARKTGGGGKAGDYVLVFDLNLKPKSIEKAKSCNPDGASNIRVKLVGQPVKFALTRSGEGNDFVPFTNGMCAWSGRTETCPPFYSNEENVLTALYRK